MEYIYSSTEAKWDRMELLHMHIDGDMAKQEEVA
jgi:hypothetical protein